MKLLQKLIPPGPRPNFKRGQWLTLKHGYNQKIKEGRKAQVQFVRKNAHFASSYLVRVSLRGVKRQMQLDAGWFKEYIA